MSERQIGSLTLLATIVVAVVTAAMFLWGSPYDVKAEVVDVERRVTGAATANFATLRDDMAEIKATVSEIKGELTWIRIRLAGAEAVPAAPPAQH